MSALTGPYGYNEALKLFRYVRDQSQKSEKFASEEGLRFNLRLHPPMSLTRLILSNFRKYYQNPVIEIGLAVSTVAHVAAAYALNRKAQALLGEATSTISHPWYTRLHKLTGRILVYTLPFHVLATRISVLLGYSPVYEFDAVKQTMVGWMPLVFVPWYSLLVASGVYHTTQGVMLSLHRFQLIPSTWYHKLSENKVLSSASVAVISGVLAGLYGFATIPGIPERTAVWSAHLQNALKLGRH